jgi:hypothetical protein
LEDLLQKQRDRNAELGAKLAKQEDEIEGLRKQLENNILIINATTRKNREALG